MPSFVQAEGSAAANAWSALDEIGKICEQYGTAQWVAEVAPRLAERVRPLPGDRKMMRVFAVAICYSQNARSKQVSALIETDEFCEAFADFEPAKLARLQPGAIIDRHWPLLSAIRFRGKVERIVRCAQGLCEIQEDLGSFARYLRTFKIPQRLRSVGDLDAFWERFDLLREDLRRRGMPFFRSTTSLLQLLLDLDFDSVKPDLIVMRLARRIGLTDRELGDLHFRSVAREIQRYAIARGLRAGVVDLMMLAFGGQTGARDLLSRRFCPPSDPCGNLFCPLADKARCEAFSR